MLRRNLLAIVCVSTGAALAFVCGFVILNFIQLARAQTFVGEFVRQALDDGPAMALPAVAPAAATILSHDRMIGILTRTRKIGPLVGVEQTTCAVHTDAGSLCGGQLMGCVVTGTGRAGRFEADIALCRGGDLAAYLLAASQWKLDFTGGDPGEEQDRSNI